MSTELNKTIHANEQIGAAIREWIDEMPLDVIREELAIAYATVLMSQSQKPSRQIMWLGLAAIKLMEVLEVKEREAANGL